MRKFRTLLCLVLLGLMIPAALRMRGQLPMDTQPLIEKKYGGWAGVLRLWVCEGWKPGAGSAAGWLNRCIAGYEKAHPGVYVQPEYVDASAMHALEEDGLTPPDLVLFPPGGIESPSLLLPLEGDYAIRPGLTWSDRAVPVMLGGYMWVWDATRLTGIPRSWRDAEATLAVPPDEPGRLWSAALLALCSGKYREDAPALPSEPNDALELGLLPDMTEPTPSPAVEDGPLRCLLPAGFAASAEAWRDFVNGDAAAMPVTQWEVRRLQGLSDQRKDGDWHLAAGANAFTDQVLYLGIVSRSTPSEKAGLCQAFARHLLSDDCQSELHRIGAFAVTGAESGYAAGDPLVTMDGLLRRDTPVTPGPFDIHWRMDAEPIVRKFLDGDPDPAALWGQLSARLREKDEH